MNFVILLIVACAFSAVAAKAIKAVPWLWYGIALALDATYAYGIAYSLPPAVLQVLSVVVQRGTFAAALFVVVMYVGVFSERSWVRRTIGPVRAELSIIACILAFAHALNYLSSYLGVLCTNIGVIGGNQLASLAIAVVLFALLLVLGVTSAKALKRRVKASIWKNVQRSSYAFFALIYVHELLILYPSAIKGAGDALSTCIASGIVFASYYVLRLARFFADKKERACGVVFGSSMKGGGGAQDGTI